MTPNTLKSRISHFVLISGVIAFTGLSSPSFAGPAAAQQNQSSTGATPTLSMPAAAEQSSEPKEPAAQPSGTILEIAENAGQFTTLVAAINAAGLTQTLSGAGPFTVFAPSDAAFAKLPAGTLENLLMPENKSKLAAILSYHVVPGRVGSADLAGVTTTPATVQGGTLAVEAGSGVKINGATVTTADLSASNGVIHVIDTVLMPPPR